MHPIIYYILCYLALGTLGTALAGKKVTAAVRRERWWKTITYIILTAIVITAIFFDFFQALVLVIVAGAAIELFRINFSVVQLSVALRILSLVIFFAAAIGLVLFAREFTPPFLLFIYFQVLVFDGCCQVAGQLFGKHRLMPAISPTKTVEGLLGGWLCCIAAGWLATSWLNISPGAYQILFGLLAGLLTGFTSFCGDLLASWYKRKAGIKDYSKWLPGQGGFLDRFDSLLFTGAACFLLYITIFRDEFREFINPVNQ